MTKIYSKLVRDHIPEILDEKNVVHTRHTASAPEYAQKLREKLQEEVDEFLADESIEEP